MVEVEGKIFSGENKASEFLEIEPYRNFIEEKLGFEPFAGTLNLKLKKEKTDKIKEKAPEYHMESKIYNGKEIGGLKLYGVQIGDLKAGIVEPDRTRYGKDVLEIVAPLKLREKLNLEDGDILTVSTG